MTLLGGSAPKTPDHQASLAVKKQKRAGVEMEKRDLVYKVRLSESELKRLRDGNVENVARFLRESALDRLAGKEQTQVYTKIDRDFLLELSRIGNNLNQIAKAINTDIAGTGTFDKVRLLHLLIAVRESLEDLKR